MLHAYHLVNSKEDYVLILAKINLYENKKLYQHDHHYIHV